MRQQDIFGKVHRTGLEVMGSKVITTQRHRIPSTLSQRPGLLSYAGWSVRRRQGFKYTCATQDMNLSVSDEIRYNERTEWVEPVKF